ncbi:MAG: hypothetical protein Q9227_009452 [Pyrenula ochraceoflavens]
MATLAVPGQVLGQTSSHGAGPGTHVWNSQIVASIAGPTITLPENGPSGKPTITVVRAEGSPIPGLARNETLPALEDIVVCQVTRVQQRQAICSIIAINPSDHFRTPEHLPHLPSTPEDVRFQAILRREDVRMTEKDRIVMNDMFRVGDFVRAQIINLGDERSYYISTAGNEFGVVMAKSESGKSMVPRSWRDMVDAGTGKTELRKVAKPS